MISLSKSIYLNSKDYLPFDSIFKPSREGKAAEWQKADQ